MKYDLHIHTTYSAHGAFKFDSIIEPKDAIRVAVKKGLDGIAITDHDTVKGVKICRSYASNKLEIISGCEIASIQGHILAYGIDEWDGKKMDAQEAVDKIHELGGIAVAAHPFKTGMLKKGLQEFTKKLDLDGIEVLSYHLNKKENAMAKKFAERMKLGMTAGTDAHISSDIGEVRTVSQGDLLEDIKNARTKVEGIECPVIKTYLTLAQRALLLTKSIFTKGLF